MNNAAQITQLLREQIAAIESGPNSTFPPSRMDSEDTGVEGLQHMADTADVVDATEEAAEEQKAFRKIERLASMREHASVALRKRLLRDGYSEHATACAVERAVACGLIDDKRYADVLVRSRLSQGRGLRGIATELADLDIDAQEVEAYQEAQNSFDDQDEVQRALALLERKPPRSKNAREGAYRRLINKGYSSNVAASAARQWSERMVNEP